MAVAVKGGYETYCTTSISVTDDDQLQGKEIVFRIDPDNTQNCEVGKITVLAETYVGTFNNYTADNFPTSRWMSGSRNNMLPADAPYFFTSQCNAMGIPSNGVFNGGLRFPRLRMTVAD